MRKTTAPTIATRLLTIHLRSPVKCQDHRIEIQQEIQQTQQTVTVSQKHLSYL